MQGTRPKPMVLISLDGYGIAPPGPGNGITLAKTPNLNKYWVSSPHGYLHASGSAVGLPHGTQGNSEVGHINMGAGKVVYQDLPRIDTSIANGTFFGNPTLVEAMQKAKQSGNRTHIMGICSTGNVHGSLEHLFALVKTAGQAGLRGPDLVFHVFTDGRDANPRSSKNYIEELESEMKRHKVGVFGSITGRYYAMDRDERWERTKMAYDMIVKGVGEKVNAIYEAIDTSYLRGETDEFIKPFVVTDRSGNPVGQFTEGDSMIFSNYRPDRAIQIATAFTAPDFIDFEVTKFQNIAFVGMTEYEKGMNMQVAFPAEDITMPLGRVVAEAGLRQLRVSESEKYPHVTYFINGGREEPYPGEDRVEFPSPRVATYDMKPEMAAYEVTIELLKRIKMDIYDFIMVNYANGDMVAHTGVIPATVKAVEVIDEVLGAVVDTVVTKGGACIITADHGNAEELINLHTGEVDTEHSTNPIPFIYVSQEKNPKELQFGILADVAPTILAKMNLPKPSQMTGRNLLA